jgi:hypothetical protein
MDFYIKFYVISYKVMNDVYNTQTIEYTDTL